LHIFPSKNIKAYFKDDTSRNEYCKGYFQHFLPCSEKAIHFDNKAMALTMFLTSSFLEIIFSWSPENPITKFISKIGKGIATRVAWSPIVKKRKCLYNLAAVSGKGNKSKKRRQQKFKDIRCERTMANVFHLLNPHHFSLCITFNVFIPITETPTVFSVNIL
jgi:hypothetical protein